MPVPSPHPIDTLVRADTKIRVLLVDDQLIIVEAVRRMLAGQPDIEFHAVTDAHAAVAAARTLHPTVILQDLVMPGLDGFQLIDAYRAEASLREVPVIVLSSKDEPKLKAHGFVVGANDYLVKLPDQLEILARIRHHSSGYIKGLERDAALRALHDSQEQLALANAELQKLAALDSLTGIANRRRFDEALHIEWQRGWRQHTPLALLLCDVDSFKQYNDTFGHPAGDLCLKKTAGILTGQLKRPADLAARYGGEEFAILLPATDLAGARQLAEACRAQLEHLALPHPQAQGGAGRVTMSIGVACMVPNENNSMEQLVAAADKALYEAKRGGRNMIVAAPVADPH